MTLLRVGDVVGVLIQIPVEHSLLYLFADDLFHQILFYFGAVAGLGILLWEKRTKREIQWEWILGLLGVCTLIASYQCWIDEHHNSQVLIQEKAGRVSEVNKLSAALEGKQAEIDWLRDHRVIQVSQSGQDPVIVQSLLANAAALKSLSERVDNKRATLKKRVLEISTNMLKFLNGKLAEREQLWQPINRSRPADQANADWQLQAERMREQDALLTQQIYQTALTDYTPTIISLLEEIRDEGEQSTAIKDQEIDDLKRRCQIANTFIIQECATELGAIGQRMR